MWDDGRPYAKKYAYAELSAVTGAEVSHTLRLGTKVALRTDFAGCAWIL